MSLTPTQPQINSSFNQNNGSFGTYTNSRTNLDWPWMSGATTMYFPCSWNSSGNVSGGSWSASTTCGSNANLTGVSSNAFSGGVNGSSNIYATIPSGGSFAVAVNQFASCGSSSPYVGGNSVTQPQFNFYVQQMSNTTQLFTIGPTYNGATYVDLIRLPAASAVVGRILYIVNYGVNNFAGVSSYSGEVIDGFANGSVRIPQWGCIGLTPNGAGTAWYIVSYYNGGLPSSSGVYSVNGTVLSSPVAVFSNVGSGQSVQLPNPVTWGKGTHLSYIVHQTANTNRYGQPAMYTNGFLRQDTTLNKYFEFFTGANSLGRYDHNYGIAFITDGTWWYITSIFDGQSCYIDATQQTRSTINKPIFITETSDGGNPTPIVGAGQASPMYFKMGHTSGSNGFVIDTYGFGGYVCSTNNIRCFKLNGTLNYNAFAMIQAGVAGTIINFPVGMYPSAY